MIILGKIMTLLQGSFLSFIMSKYKDSLHPCQTCFFIEAGLRGMEIGWMKYFSDFRGFQSCENLKNIS